MSFDIYQTLPFYLANYSEFKTIKYLFIILIMIKNFNNKNIEIISNFS